MITSNALIVELYPNILTMPDPPDAPITSNEADFIQCEQDPDSGKITRILVASAVRPPTEGGKQNQHSSAYALLVAYAKKEATDILHLTLTGYQGNLEKQLTERHLKLIQILNILALCVTPLDISSDAASTVLTRAYKDIAPLAKTAQDTLPVLRLRLKPTPQDEQTPQVVPTLEKIFTRYLHHMAGQIATNFGNPLLRDLNLLPGLTYKKPEDESTLRKRKKQYTKLSEQASMETLTNTREKNKKNILCGVAGLLDLRSVLDDRLVPAIIARHLILVRLVFWNKLKDIRDEDIIENIAKAYGIDAAACNTIDKVRGIYDKLHSSTASLAEVGEERKVGATAAPSLAEGRAQSAAPASSDEEVSRLRIAKARAQGVAAAAGDAATAAPDRAQRAPKKARKLAAGASAAGTLADLAAPAAQPAAVGRPGSQPKEAKPPTPRQPSAP